MSVEDQLRIDGLPKPLLLTTLRGWANRRPEVQRVVLSHDDENYMITILTDAVTVEGMQATNRSLRESIDGIFDGRPRPKSYLVGFDCPDEEMFDQPGSLMVVDKLMPPGRGV